ncbi:hypothetical protein U3516DRAFT_760953 [Neocallimastix sp. 'constans']|jgi:hypothetical protein
MAYNYDNFVIIIYDKVSLVFNYSKLNALIHCEHRRRTGMTVKHTPIFTYGGDKNL